MKTIEIELYKFTELSENAKSAAIEKEKENMEIFLDFFNDDCNEQISEKGFKGNIKLQYSLSYCQGDGLSFSCDYYDNLKDLFIGILGAEKSKTIDCIINNISFECKGNNGRYCYASKNDISLELNNYCYVKSSINIDNLISKVESKLKDLYIDLCSQLEIQGYNEIEYQYSDESIIETLIANDYDFTINGMMY
jgi:hypothetical protein